MLHRHRTPPPAGRSAFSIHLASPDAAACEGIQPNAHLADDAQRLDELEGVSRQLSQLACPHNRSPADADCRNHHLGVHCAVRALVSRHGKTAYVGTCWLRPRYGDATRVLLTGKKYYSSRQRETLCTQTKSCIRGSVSRGFCVQTVVEKQLTPGKSNGATGEFHAPGAKCPRGPNRCLPAGDCRSARFACPLVDERSVKRLHLA